MGTFLKRTFWIGLLGGIAYGAWRALGGRATESGQPWGSAQTAPPAPPGAPAAVPGSGHHIHVPTQVAPGGGPETEGSAEGAPVIEPLGDVPAPAPAPTPAREEAPLPEADYTGATAWVEPIDGECPASHPVKAKESSGIYHLPGGAAYERTVPDRCYTTAEAAEADGFRAAKR